MKLRMLDIEKQRYCYGDLTSELMSKANAFLMLNAYSHKIQTERFGSATFVKTDAYSPLIPASVPYAIEFDVIFRQSNDIIIKRRHTGNGFVIGYNGIYQISAEWFISIPFPEDMNFVALDIYKNGSFYRQLDRKPMKGAILLGGNAMHKEMSLQGTQTIDLTISDYIEIRLTHDKAGGFGANESHGGTLNIDYLHNWRKQ